MRVRSLFSVGLAGAILVACGGGGGGSGVTPAGPLAHSAKRRPMASSTGVVSLGRYNINPAHVYVAGISSGGFMAVQLHFAYSGTFKGAAIYAGGPDDCAQDSEATAIDDCGGAGLYGSELTPSENFINSNQNTSGMDPVSNISGQKVYLWSGTGDTVVSQKTMNDLETEYQHYGASVTYDNSFDAEHGWESPYGANSCDTLGSPYMITCDKGSSVYDSEQTWLSLFLGTLNAKNTGTLNGSLMNFNQTQFSTASGLDTNGWVFVPQSCASGTQCSLVVALDGCEQYQAAIGTDFVSQSGLDEWADTNDIIVLYPYQVTTSSNPDGCWDWWGYASSSYALKSGPQMAAIYAMVQHLEGGTGTASPSPSPTASPTSSPTSSPTVTPSPTSTPSPTPAPTATPPYSQKETNTVVEFYAMGYITLNEYLQLGEAYGYDTDITLYDCGGTWTDSSSCGPMTY
jgi:poly(3-hydroxybutyrate) depolymerase